MDERTKQKLINLQLREQDSDYSINLIEYYFSDKLSISWVDILNYISHKWKISSLRVKELFLEEELSEKVDTIITNDINLALSGGEIDE